MLNGTRIREASKVEQELTTLGHQGKQQRPVTPDTVRNATQHEAAATPVRFEPGDSANPINWSNTRKAVIVLTGSFTILNGTLGSSIPSGAITYLAAYFNVTSKTQLVLPISVYQVGFVCGALLLGPLSETYGRRMVMIGPFGVFTVFTIASASAPNWSAFIFFRFVCGLCASSAVSVVGGIYADIYDDPVTRGRANAMYLAAITMGPQFAPMIAGFLSRVSWKWTFWVSGMASAVCFVPLFFLPETYAPVILAKRAQKLRKETGDASIFAPIELEKKGWKQIIMVFLARPIRMMFTESLVTFTCVYLAFETGIYYLFFQAYPIIFETIYGMRPGISGLAYLPIALGVFLGCGVFLTYDLFFRRAQARESAWVSVEEYRRLPLACIGGPLCVTSLFWLGWTASPQIHWAVPMTAGLCFGMGFYLLFMALLNYLADAYKTFSASAMAAVSCCRSAGSAVLPLIAGPMFTRTGVAWGCSLLGLISLALGVVPFIFIRYGNKMRARSRMCQELMEVGLPEVNSRKDGRQRMVLP